MGQRPVHHVRLRTPVDPVDLFSRLARALGVSQGARPPEEIVNLDFPALDSKFRDNYLLREVLRKYPAFDLGIDTKRVALESFLDDERLNVETNDRLRTYNRENPCVNQIIYLAGRKAVRVLGRFDIETFLEGVRFGPGATTSKKRSNSSVEWKLSTNIHVTQNALPLAQLVLGEVFPRWAGTLDSWNQGESLFINNFERLECVPKNAKTGRTIGIGPDFNVMAQLAVDYSMRRKLFRSGINLSDQTINQRRSLLGSITGDLATLDLKSASNSVTMGLVWRILGDHPMGTFDPTWYRLLDTLRVERVALPDGSSHEYELFSAMGNGATFALESLIFWALSCATCEHLGLREDVSVYGDDLIVPVDAVPTLVEVLEWCGLRLNQDKSFWNKQGPCFRESCGKHYLDGVDVSPFYVDRPLTSVDQVLLLANNIVRWSRTSFGRDGRLLPVWLWVISHLPDSIRRCRIPFGEQDDGLLSDFDEARPSVSKLDCGTFAGYKCDVLERTYIETQSIVPSLAYERALYNLSVKRFTPPSSKLWYESLRDERTPISDNSPWVLHFRKRTVRNWPYLGPWVTDTHLLDLDRSDVEVLVMLIRMTR